MLDAHVEAAMTAWRVELRRTGVSATDLRELEDHLLTAFEHEVDAGYSQAKAITRAQQQLGDPIHLARELHKEDTMHPLTKLTGLAIAIAALFTVVTIESGSALLLFSLPPLALILFVTFGGLLASCGLQRVRRALAVGLLDRDADVEEREQLAAVCRRGHRLAYAAGGLQVLLGAAQVLSTLDTPALLGEGLGYTMVGLLQAVVIADLGFGTLGSWITRSAAPPAAC